MCELWETPGQAPASGFSLREPLRPMRLDAPTGGDDEGAERSITIIRRLRTLALLGSASARADEARGLIW